MSPGEFQSGRGLNTPDPVKSPSGQDPQEDQFLSLKIAAMKSSTSIGYIRNIDSIDLTETPTKLVVSMAWYISSMISSFE